MQPILRAWAKLFSLKKTAAFFAAFLAFISIETENAFAQEIDSLPFDQPAEPAVLANPAEVAAPVPPAEPAALATPPSAAAPAPMKPAAPAPSDIKTVLYLGGGERSPWFHLGVLYAIEEFGVPVDSVVGTSWGGWIGSLWARGVAPDEIQRLMLDPAIAPYVGHDYSNDPQDGDVDAYQWPVSQDGIPSIRKRLTVSEKFSGGLDWKEKRLDADSVRTAHAVAKLRFQETLYRQSVLYFRPFSVQSCDENALPKLQGSSVEEIVKSLPLWSSADAANLQNAPGEICPFYALPAEDRPDELAIIVVADPLRNPVPGNAKDKLLRKMIGDHLSNQPGLVIRAHAIQDTSRNAWIQAGFSAMEQRRTSEPALTSRKVNYGKLHMPNAKPWFRYSPSLEMLAPQIQGPAKTYWVASDTGMTGPRNFAERISSNPAYDSLDFVMQPNGELRIESVARPTVDFAVGGFGSNVIGANAYAEASLRYVDHIEMQLVLAGFLGTTSYGIQPRLQISKLFSKHWNLALGYDYLKLQTVQSFRNDFPRSLRFDYEERSDLNLVMSYDFDDRQRLSAEFLFGNRSYALDPDYFRTEEIKAYPVSPMIHYAFRTSKDTGMFAQDGLEFDAMAGMESIGYNFGIIDLVPIYWKILLNTQYAVSPKPILSFAVGATAGIERYHEDGFGYVYPRSFDYLPLDLVYRFHAQATPWSSEWYNPDLSSHEFAMVRASGSLHGKYFGLWLFTAYFHDIENSSLSKLSADRFVIEPALRFAYKSISIYAGMNRIVDSESLNDFTKPDGYTYFVRVGNYSF